LAVYGASSEAGPGDNNNKEDDINCLAEFETCVMNRDCCNDLDCVAGDWAVTTDSTCLSTRSQALNDLSRTEKIQILKEFYDHKVPPKKRKTTVEVVKLYEKNARTFPKLVAKLEKKYDISMTEPIHSKTTGDEL